MAKFPRDIDLSALDGQNGFFIRGPAELADFGANMAIGDVTGDGIDDLLVGAPRLGIPDNGGVALFPGSRDGFPATLSIGTTMTGGQGNDDMRTVGRSIATLGDINGDGIGDFIVGVPFQRIDFGTGGLNDPLDDYPVGVAYVVYGGAHVRSLTDLDALGSNGFVIMGDDLYGRLGTTVAAAGDVNGDGLADILVSAHRASAPGLRDTGEAYLIFGSTSRPSANVMKEGSTQDPFEGTGIDVGDMTASDGVRIVNLPENSVSAGLGYHLAGAGDVNGDGYDDFILGAPWMDGNSPYGSIFGESYVIFGGPSMPAEIDVQTLNGSNGFTMTGGQGLGFKVAGIGDVNGDGFDDVMVSGDRGRAYVVFGRDDGVAQIDVDTLDPTEGWNRLFWGPVRSVAALGDVDGDGYDDFAYGLGSSSLRGSVTVVYGGPERPSGYLTYVGPRDELFMGASVAAGDLNGDGQTDLAFGAPADSSLAKWGGSAFVVLGPEVDTSLLRLNVTLADQVDRPIVGAEATFRPGTGTETVSYSDSGGRVQFELTAGQQGVIELSRPYFGLAGDPEITAGDALDVLRMAVGLTPSFGAPQAQSFIAADIDRDGQVTALDALEVLRAAVGLAPEHAPRWVFFDAATDWEGLGLSVTDTHLSEGVTLASGWTVSHIDMTGILLGHMAET